jgi:mycofactocin system glycosyltransferase
VVIPTHDRPADLDRCLAALANQAVMVVDDGSTDPVAVAAVCAPHGARLITRPVAGGPAAARNTAMAAVDTEVVAFLDDDCVPPPGWLEDLAAHFADPAIGAVAPRIGGGLLDMGERAGRVGPGLPIGYVPSAALLVRRAALTHLDEALRYGEDVDLVWRMCDAGWTVRYDPRVVVEHAEPADLRGRMARRFAYGTSAGALAQRHPGHLAPLRLAPVQAAAAALLVADRPLAAGALALGAPLRRARDLKATGLPPAAIAGLAISTTAQTLAGLGRAACTVGAPALAAALVTGRGRRPAAILLGAHLAADWHAASTAGSLRAAGTRLAGDVAYGAGVWRGCLRARTVDPLIPRLVRRTPTSG